MLCGRNFLINSATMGLSAALTAGAQSYHIRSIMANRTSEMRG
jgi:hypothetical protein